MTTRRHLLAAFGAAALSALPLAAAAQEKPLEWVLGYAAGGGSDVVARTVAEQMGKTLGRTIVVNNKPGAATNIAADYVAKSRDIGNVMLTADFATLAANPALFSKLPYDAEKDFKPVGMLARFPLLLVVAPNVPVKNWKEFSDWAQRQPEGVNYASAGLGSPHHLATELLREKSGLKLTHVPYRGAAPAVQDLLGGQIAVGMIDTASVQQYVLSGKLRAVGVASPQRLKTLPEVPTLAEQGLSGFEAYAWQGLVVPAATSAELTTKLSQALQAALQSVPVKARFQTLGLEPLPGTPEQMATYARSERARWGALIRANNIKLD
ncbi:Bug family tripartite tricarboxylate transporter substrate binding protein [Azohydromonas caseinilytica]|uniref:Tripartite tricarboxylate transporter substrate binding protein n=1 Tax=Azohydromonas caseinilytica TaxID=2728836 RepID=A0A848FGN5_9BURK|nr:tripartite tricarboxylate transporter substrate binding protein [Azohydromonas caseinilytica]NML18618.1 tripartite tricarboxylate transporter substrate binding protein [Azohydromonas caseinilytica]